MRRRRVPDVRRKAATAFDKADYALWPLGGKARWLHQEKAEEMSESSVVGLVTASNRWRQLFFGIICMSMIANLHYGWTFFFNPIHDEQGWSRAAIQVAFTIFIFAETWLVPIEGWFVDRYGPRIVVMFGARSSRWLGLSIHSLRRCSSSTLAR
jgi:hypothetical protein